MDAMDVLNVGPGVSFESGRVRTVRRVVPVVVVVAREAVECVLFATERTDAAEDLIVSVRVRCDAGWRTECMLATSSSTGLRRADGPCRLGVATGVVGVGFNISSTDTSISATVR